MPIYSGDPAPTAPPGTWGGCDWPIDEGCLGDDWDDLDPTVQARSIHLASATLHRLTGYRVGGCPITVRPCQRRCVGPMSIAYYDMASIYGQGSFWPTNLSGTWVNSCGCATDCSCVELCEVALPPPVGSVTEVKHGGVVVSAANYRLDGNRVVWIGAGDCPWPLCQDLTAPDTEPGTFSITYLNSYPVDALGAYAAGIMANEYAKACSGGKCRLPVGVTSIARQGVAFEIASGAFPGGLTGIREVDSYLALWNPEPIRQQPKVWSPDIPAPRVMR